MGEEDVWGALVVDVGIVLDGILPVVVFCPITGLIVVVDGFVVVVDNGFCGVVFDVGWLDEGVVAALADFSVVVVPVLV